MDAIVNNTKMYAQINKAIDDAIEAGDILSFIGVSEDEMRQFLHSPQFDMTISPDTHYGQNVIPYPTRIAGVNSVNDVPKRCTFRGIEIVVNS